MPHELLTWGWIHNPSECLFCLCMNIHLEDLLEVHQPMCQWLLEQEQYLQRLMRKTRPCIYTKTWRTCFEACGLWKQTTAPLCFAVVYNRPFVYSSKFLCHNDMQKNVEVCQYYGGEPLTNIKSPLWELNDARGYCLLGKCVVWNEGSSFSVKSWDVQGTIQPLDFIVFIAASFDQMENIVYAAKFIY